MNPKTKLVVQLVVSAAIGFGVGFYFAKNKPTTTVNISNSTDKAAAPAATTTATK